MKQKLSLVYIFGVLSPIILMVLNGYIGERKHNSWNYDNLNSISSMFLMISIFFSGVIVFLNYKNTKRSFWYTLSITTGIVLILLLWFGRSVSNIGF